MLLGDKGIFGDIYPYLNEVYICLLYYYYYLITIISGYPKLMIVDDIDVNGYYTQLVLGGN